MCTRVYMLIVNIRARWSEQDRFVRRYGESYIDVLHVAPAGGVECCFTGASSATPRGVPMFHHSDTLSPPHVRTSGITLRCKITDTFVRATVRVLFVG